MSIITAKALNAMNTRVSRKPVAANTLSDGRTLGALRFGNSATRSAALVLDGIASVGARKRVNQLGQSRGSGFPGHSRKARGFLPGIDIEPRERGKDAEPCSVSIFADGRAEEFIELRPDKRR
jgi:hypothetical protein